MEQLTAKWRKAHPDVYWNEPLLSNARQLAYYNNFEVVDMRHFRSEV